MGVIRCSFGGRFGQVQEDAKGRALSQLTVKLDASTHIRDDSCNDGQAKASSVSRFLGGVERFEDTLLIILRDAAAGV